MFPNDFLNELNLLCRSSYDPESNLSELIEKLDKLLSQAKHGCDVEWIDASLKQSFFFNHQQAMKEHASLRLKNKSSIVYLLRGNVTGYYKIGVSTKLEERIRQVDNGTSEEISLISSSTGGQDLEAQLHYKYKNKRVKGEWFCLEDCDVSEIKSIMEGK